MGRRRRPHRFREFAVCPSETRVFSCEILLVPWSESCVSDVTKLESFSAVTGLDRAMAVEVSPSTGDPDFNEPGIFSWNLRADVVFGDSAIARLYGFSAETALNGQPMSSYLCRVHPDDLPSVALDIHNAIAGGKPYHCEYRVRDANDKFLDVVSLGRCFRSTDREPSQFAGIIYPVDPYVKSNDDLHETCMTAIRLAKEAGRERVATRLASIILEMDPVSR
ncbi:diguanylate cyclase [Rhizobium leguminosarum]|uniref:Diguanylate cyclase n=2 Tax=Rhizobium/Agrobacterium group TaxID=227290 RepID=A0ABY1XH26_9HYPH|nr:diguanylate cyclase [Rhizobium leguminosarum]TBC53800.1 diguanylate cyclase [Rhizobium leguminosarum]TBE57827.1 diguanylate cyclase [Rhizobium beringeri]